MNKENSQTASFPAQKIKRGQDAKFERAYQLEIDQLLIDRLRLALGIGIPIYGGFWFMDLIQAPGLSERFLTIRAIVVAVAAITIWLTHTKFGERNLVPISVTMVATASFGISLMTMSVGGFVSDYYYGHLLILFLVGLFIPWRLAVTVLFCGLLMVGYFGVNLAVHGAGPEMIAPSFFLLATCIFTCVATAVGENFRRRDLALRRSLEQANDDLMRLDEAKTAFFANVSHELRTPLTLMLGPVETLLQEESTEEHRTLLRAMLANTHRLLRHVNLLLDTAKLEAGQLQLDLVESNLAAMLEDLVTASLPHAGRKGIEIATEGLDSIPEFSFDPDKVEMIAANLLSNALKFTPDGGRIAVRARVEIGAVVFEVEDNGPGIPQDQRGLIFDRFHQVDSSLTRREEGTGLGLTLARELARLHGGDVVVESEAGRGSVFRVTLPREVGVAADRRVNPRRREDQMVRARADALARREYQRRSRSDTLLADIRQPRLEPGALAQHQAPLDAPTVLVVDDNADLRAYLASELSREYRVETAGDGVEGLKKALHLRPQLVISDVMMPVMNGYELCRRLRAEPMLKATPIILVTAKAGSEAVVEGLEIGADDYVTKPFSMEELEARIAAQLRAKNMESQLSERETRLAAIGHLTSTVVHDLRNALTLIKGYSDLAHSIAVGGGQQDELVADIEQVQSATQRLQRMTTEILEYARGGAADLKLTKIPVRDYIRGTLEPIKKHLASQGVELRFRDELPSNLMVKLDADRFGRILENLVGNARDALVDHSGDRIVFVQSEVEKGLFRVRVADTGPGIPSDRVDSLFEPFATGKRKGTGLGLVTVRNLAKAHGGWVEVEPKAEEGGAAFTVTIPIGDGSRAELAEGLARGEAPRAAVPS
ncbi:MAG: response regulator [bacterium]|nr:response regulator [bacterium]